jgi:hypothetical protein
MLCLGREGEDGRGGEGRGRESEKPGNHALQPPFCERGGWAGYEQGSAAAFFF